MSQCESTNFLTSCISTPLYPVQLNMKMRILILRFIDSITIQYKNLLTRHALPVNERRDDTNQLGLLAVVESTR